MNGESTKHDAPTRQMPALTEVLAEWEQANQPRRPNDDRTRRMEALSEDDPTQPVEPPTEDGATQPMAALDENATRKMPAFHDDEGTAPTLKLESLPDDA